MTKFTLSLLAATALAGVAHAQTPAPAAAPADEPLPEASAPPTPEESAAELEFLKAQVEALQAQVESLRGAVTANAPNFRASPQFGTQITDPNDPTKKVRGFEFKVRGRLHYDTGYVTNPNDAVATKNLGFNTRLRRARLGVQGAFPGNFGYNIEIDFASNNVSFADAILSWAPYGSPVAVTLGHHYPFQGLEQITSSNYVSTIERASFSDAFGYSRRLGASLAYAPSDSDLRLYAGVFGDTVNGNFDNDDWQASARVTYSPEAFGGRAHIGGSYQYRRFQSNALNFQYRSRPGTQVTDIRFVDAGTLAADGDQIFGLEAAYIAGPFHIAAEGHYNEVDGIRPGAVLTGGDTSLTGVRLQQDPSFFGAFVEVGYFFTRGTDGTPDTRGWNRGSASFDRIRPRNGFDKGGPGAIQLVGKVDYLDLKDRVGGTGTNIVGGVLNGGEQWLYSAALNWHPIDYVRFILQYSRAEIEGGPRAGAIRPLSTRPLTDRKYSVDFFGVRSQFDF